MSTKKPNKQDNGLSKRSPYYNKFPPNQGFGLVRKTTPRKTDIDQFCVQQCRKLRDFVKKKKWIPISTSKNNWGHQVRKLRDSLKSPEAEQMIVVLLDKYFSLSSVIGHVPKKTGGFPKCKDMTQLRQCWDWINNVIAKHERDNVNVEISDQAKSIVTILKRKDWPGGCLDKLPMAVQASLGNFNQFREKLTSIILKQLFPKDEHSPEKVWKFAIHIKDKLSTSSQFIQDWFESVWKRIHEWKDWNGNIMLEVFKPESKNFQKWGKNVARNWSGKTELWDKLIERLGIDVS